jgi:hypothetical protein
VRGCGLGSSGARECEVMGSFENANELSDSINSGEFLDVFNNHQTLKDYAAWSHL